MHDPVPSVPGPAARTRGKPSRPRDDLDHPMPPRLDVDPETLGRFCRERGIERLALFGSVLRPDFGEDSDVDVLVRFRTDVRIGLIRFAGIQRELSELVGRDVDLVPEEDLRPALREHILSTAETLYAS